MLGAKTWRGAFAELALIACGVLIALGVNNWNDVRLDRVLEREYLRGLEQDLAADLDELAEAGQRATMNENAALKLSAALQGDIEPEVMRDSLVNWVLTAGYLYFPVYQPFTLEDLQSTGNLRILRDSEVRRQLAVYYGLIESRSQWHERYRWIQRDYTETFQGVLGVPLARAYERGEPVSVSQEEADRILEKIRGLSRAPAAIEGMVWVQNRQMAVHAVVSDAASTFMDVIQAH